MRWSSRWCWCGTRTRSSAPLKVTGKEIYVEFVALGNSVKVTAIDPDSGIEASVVCPASAAQHAMAEAARRKLEYVLRKKT